MDRVLGVLSQANSSRPVEDEIAPVMEVANRVGAERVRELETWVALPASTPEPASAIEQGFVSHPARTKSVTVAQQVG